MNYLNKLNELEASEARDFIKQNINDESFVSEVLENKEESIPLLLKHKFLPEPIISKMSNEKESASFLLSHLIESKYVPSSSFMESIASFGEEMDNEISSALKAFPSLPINIPFIMLLINNGLTSSAIEIVKSKKDFQKAEILILILRTKTEDLDFIQKAFEDEEVSSKVGNDLDRGLNSYSLVAINEFIKNSNINDICPDKLLKLDLSSEAYTKVLESKLEGNNKKPAYSYHRPRWYKELIDWTPSLEEVDEEVVEKFIVSHAPIGSKFRRNSISNDPARATDDEIIELIDSGIVNPDIFYDLLKRDINVIKKANLDSLEDHISPGRLIDAISRDSEKGLFLFNEISSKYKPALRKIIPVDEIPESANKRKKSYFFEAFEAIKRRDVVEFREALSHGYDLEKFMSDTRQSSKKKSCENINLSNDFISKLEKEEFLSFISSPFRLYFYDDVKLSYKLSIEEAFLLLEKMDVSSCFSLCDDKAGFISRLDENELYSVFSSNKEEIMEEKNLLSSYLKRASNFKVDLDADSIRSLASIMTKEELSKVVSIRSYDSRNSIDIKCSDGQFLISDEELLKLITDKYIVESEDFISMLSRRNPELAIQVVEAYIGGNKALSELTGEKVNIRRGSTDRFQKILEELKSGTDLIVDEIFSKGGKLEEFKSSLTDWESALEQHANGRVIHVKKTDVRELDSLAKITNLKFIVGTLVIGRNWYSEQNVDGTLDHIEIKSISVGQNLKNESHDFLKCLQSRYGIIELDVESDKTDFKLDLIIAGFRFEGDTTFLNSAIRGELDSTRNLSIDQLKFLESKGLIFTNELVEGILDARITSPEVVSWLSSRLGGLSAFTISDAEISYLDAEEVQELKRTGIQIVPASELLMIDIQDQILSQGTNFEPVNIEGMPFKEKLKIIRFIEEKIDPNYLKLNLATSNLETLETLSPYEVMRTVYSLDDNDAINLLLIPGNVSSNKKIMKGIKDLLSLSGGSITFKVQKLRRVVEMFDPSIELSVSDFLDYSNQANVVENETFSAISVSALMTVERFSSLILSQGIILKGKSKSEIFRFLRSASAKEDGYLRDTLEMISSVYRGVDGLKERILVLSEDAEDNADYIMELTNSVNSVISRLEEVASMDDVEHMHDRLVPLLSFIKSDPVQPLGQDKFRKMESSQKINEDLGFSLFFPKTRADLQYLGDENGWCVNHHSYYGDGVINKGNILVGICEKGADSSKENVIALAHFLNKGNGKYSLEQLKWSSKKKNGSKNVDATGDFNSSHILGTITTFLQQYEKNKQR